MQVGIGAAFSHVKIIKTLFRKKCFAGHVESRRMLAREGFGELKNGVRRERIIASRNPWLKEVTAAATHFMEIKHDVRLPTMEQRNPPATFRMGRGQPITVEIKPVIIRSTTWPRLIVFPIVTIGVGVQAAIL